MQRTTTTPLHATTTPNHPDASATAMAQLTGSPFPLNPSGDSRCHALLARLVWVLYPHPKLSRAAYDRSVAAIFKATDKSPGIKVEFAAALHELLQSGFADLDDRAAEAHLKTLESTAFFKLVRSTAVVTLYDDPEAWDALGYEGPSYDKGGYIERGFNDLDWLPEPRIAEYGADL